MPAVTLANVVDLSLIKMKWKEQYVSEGLNHKAIPASAKGIYSGLQLVQNITSPRIVDVQVGSDSVHAAVHLSAIGFALTYYDLAGTTITLNLSSASLDNQETVIALAITYTIGADTTAHWMAYPIADWNALTAAQQAELLVVGTINVPAPATNIDSSMILQRKRNVAWESVLRGAVPWSPLLRNSGFEHGVAGGTNPYDITDWVNDSAPTNGVFRMGATAVNSGNYSLEFNKTSTSASNAVFTQRLEVPVTPGNQNYRFVCYIRQLIAPTAGSYRIVFYWGDQNSSTWLNTTTTISAAGTDAAFRKIDEIIEVPGGSYFLKYVTIEVNAVTTASTGVAVCFDDFQVYLEQVTPYARSGALQSAIRALLTAALVVEDSSSYAPGQLAALLRFDKTTPTNEGQLVVERRDQNYSGANLPPAIELFGRLLGLGSKVLGTAANARLPRIVAPFATSGGPTLLFQSADNSGSGISVRLYSTTTNDSGFIITVNAYWDGTNWNKDVNGTGASKIAFLTDYSIKVQSQAPANNTPWTWFAWDNQPFDIYGPTSAVEMIGTIFATGSTTIQGSNLTPNNAVGLLKSPTGHTNILMDVQGYDGRGTIAVDNVGRLYRRGAYFFEDFDGLSLDSNKWTLSNIGTGITQTSNPGTHTYQMTTGTVAGNYYQITGQMYFYRKNFPRMRARIFTSNLNHSNILGAAQRIFVGWTSLYLDYDQNTHANLTHWYLQADGTFYDTGIVSNQDGGAGISAGAIISLAQIATNQVLVTVHDQNDTFAAASQVVITVVGSLGTSGRPLLAGVVNTHGIASGAPTLAVDFMEGSECSRLD